MKRPQRILYATDFSSASRRAFDTALMMAKSLNARLTIMSVLAPLVTVPDQYIDAVTIDRLDRQAREWSAQQLNKLSARAKKAGVKVAIMLLDGDPADQIVRVSRASHSNLVIVGTHGRRGLSKFFLGSVAERVVSTAACPVITVRGK
jgi:universal stress protein A